MTEMRQCANCGSRYDPADTSDPLWGIGATSRYCGPCGIAEAHLLPAGHTTDPAADRDPLADPRGGA